MDGSVRQPTRYIFYKFQNKTSFNPLKYGNVKVKQKESFSTLMMIFR